MSKSVMQIESTHNFNHKSFGNLGQIEFTMAVASATLNGAPLGQKAVEYLIGYGIRQAFTDCYSQAKDADKAQSMLAKKVQAVIDGKISLRERLDAFSRVMRDLTDQAFEQSAKMTFAAFKKSIDDDEKAEAVYEKFAESVRESLEPVARERLARESNLPTVQLSVADILATV
ncbi:MAG: hypothetical protein EHM23_36020 [Acidobacteria bacterium]|jgi:hypothetical protein|nr:MAG: hypothetical protein EHM23_36020 [Acidobacteriota bacterium]